MKKPVSLSLAGIFAYASQDMSNETVPNVAVFCDYENVAIGVREARYDEFDINLVLERILDKGKIIVKKAYAGWDAFRSAKRPMHEAAFEMIEIPHVRISGKNSADIRLVVDALDLCYTKSHIDTFVLISGDSDFSPLVGKLRENNKFVIGLGVKNSSSDLLIEGCDEFIFYDDLVRRKKKKSGGSRGGGRGRRGGGGAGRGESKPSAEAPKVEAPESAADKQGDKTEAIEIVLDVVESLFKDRDGNLWGSMVKQVLKRRRPQFSETYYGYDSFSDLLEDAGERKLLEIQRDERSGGYIIVGFGEDG